VRLIFSPCGFVFCENRPILQHFVEKALAILKNSSVLTVFSVLRLKIKKLRVIM